MKKFMIVVLVCCFATVMYAQDVKIPRVFQLKSVVDYEPYRDSVRIAAQWMINAPLNQHESTRELANRFIFEWISGAPYTHIIIREEFTKGVINNPTFTYAGDLLLNYIAGMTLTKLDDDMIADHIVQEAGIRSMLSGYKSIRNEQKNKFLEKLLKVEKKGQLTEWVKKNSVQLQENAN